MIGWHYTTRSAYRQILSEGQLVPQRVADPHHREFAMVRDYVPEWLAIWVYRKPQVEGSLISMLLYLMDAHDETDVLCLLKVGYDEDASATMLATADLPVKADKIVVKHTLTCGMSGRLGHHNEPIDLVIRPIYVSQIKLVGEWDLPRFCQRNLHNYATTTPPLNHDLGDLGLLSPGRGVEPEPRAAETISAALGSAFPELRL